ncbi:Peptide chain release factor eRF1/aRF1 like protein [Aduncisulcus paluster]|uniref:Peptide chain release factor eRF1/aRF1 like protein n=1 Tax=Aduncisulcus paluster TaxID=2918883 RepID=A0ABQ5KVF4_9EUKA|nr:Peptide chain release factor eRF1/aRF1 like protein [Aduncisulcus paluster]
MSVKLQENAVHHFIGPDSQCNVKGSCIVNQAIQLSEDVLKDVKSTQEKKLIASFFEEIATDSGKYCFGVDDTMRCLDLSYVEILNLKNPLYSKTLGSDDIN